jgi:outer membrane protein assembly factor BamB
VDVASADARWLIDAGYAPDPGPQSGALQIDSAHTGFSDDPLLTGDVTRWWTKSLGGASSFPLIAHGKVIATWVTKDKHGSLQAFEAATGASAWGPVDLGDSDISNSAYDGGRVFALRRDGLIQAFDVDSGTLLWTTQLGDSFTPEQFLSAPTAHHGFVYAISDNLGGTYAVDERNGAIAWQAGQWGYIASPAVTDDAVYVTIRCEETYRFDPHGGTEVWHHASGCIEEAFAPTYAAGLLLVTYGGGMQRLDPKSGAPVDQVMVSTDVPPAVHDHIGFFMFNDGLTALDVTDFKMSPWTHKGAGTHRPAAAPIVTGGRVYTMTSSCTLSSFDEATGAPVLSDTVQCAGFTGAGGTVGLAAAGGIIAVPFVDQLAVYGAAPVFDAGAD